jgi:hypothetical protein
MFPGKTYSLCCESSRKNVQAVNSCSKGRMSNKRTFRHPHRAADGAAGVHLNNLDCIEGYAGSFLFASSGWGPATTAAAASRNSVGQ